MVSDGLELLAHRTGSGRAQLGGSRWTVWPVAWCPGGHRRLTSSTERAGPAPAAPGPCGCARRSPGAGSDSSSGQLQGDPLGQSPAPSRADHVQQQRRRPGRSAAAGRGTAPGRRRCRPRGRRRAAGRCSARRITTVRGGPLGEGPVRDGWPAGSRCCPREQGLRWSRAPAGGRFRRRRLRQPRSEVPAGGDGRVHRRLPTNRWTRYPRAGRRGTAVPPGPGRDRGRSTWIGSRVRRLRAAARTGTSCQPSALFSTTVPASGSTPAAGDPAPGRAASVRRRAGAAVRAGGRAMSRSTACGEACARSSLLGHDPAAQVSR